MASPPVTTSPFRLGRKAIYLPNFTIALLRTPKLPPNMASFIVPLHLNKLDLRDYLYHAYNVRVLNVRSFIKQARVTQGNPNAIDARPQPNRWFRAQATKKMTVEMDKPFVWPPEYTDEDLQKWHKDTFNKAQKAQEEFSERHGQMNDTWKNKTDRSKLREQAQKLLSGERKWRSSGADNEQFYIRGPQPLLERN
ncbi:hypothetical protein MBLNU457_5436t1 [Dothideomycetes sp. NU457]